MRPRQLAGWLAAVILGGLLLIATAGLWWVGQTTSFLEWALARASTATGGALRADGLRGSLLSGAGAARLSWVADGLEVEVSDLRLRWRPDRLLSGELRLSRLSAARVAVRLPPGGDGGAPPTLPDRIALPLAIGIDALEVAEIAVGGEGFDAPRIRGLSLALRADDHLLRISRLAADVVDWARFDAEARLALAAPFAIGLEARIVPVVPDGVRLPLLLLDAEGPLQALALRLRLPAPAGAASVGEPGAGAPAWATLATTLDPLAPLPVQAATLLLDGFEPAALGLPGPRARLTGRLALTADGGGGDRGSPGADDRAGNTDAAPATLADVAWRGQLSLRNTLSGPLDAGLLPLASLAAGLHWQAGRLAIDGIEVDDGSLKGELQVDTTVSRQRFGVTLPGLAARFALRELNLSRIHREARATRLSGELKLAADRLDFDLADAGKQTLRLRGSASLEGDEVRIAALALDTPAGRLDATGSARWQAPWQVALQGRFSALEPTALAAIAGVSLPDRLAGLRGLSGDWSASGEVAPALALDSRLRVSEGRFDGLPLKLDWQGRVSPERIDGARLVASLGAMQARLSGDAGRAGDRLAVSLRLPALAALAPLLPELPALQGALTVDGEAAIPGLTPAGLERAGLDLRAELRGLRHESFTASRVRLAFAGGLAAHRAQLAVAGGRVGEIAVEGTAATGGRLVLAGNEGAADWRWEGRVESLEARAPLALALAGPMPVTVGPAGLRAGPGSVRADEGRLELARLAVVGGRVEVAGEASRLPISDWAGRLGLIPADTAAIDALTLGGTWTLAGSSIDDLDGHLDLRLRSSERFDADGKLALRLQRGALAGEVDLALPSLSVLNRLIEPEWAVAGRLRVTATVAGTLRAPSFSGTLGGRGLAMIQRRLGWHFGDGVLDARLDGDRLEVETLRLSSGEGSVSLRGGLSLEGMKGSFQLRADRLPVPIGPGQRIVVSGDTEIVSQVDALQWRGKIRADEGLIELRGGEAPSLPDDVVIVDPAQPKAALSNGQAAAPATRLPQLGADLEVDLGEQIRVRGSGVDAWLAGTLRLGGTLPEAPRATGTVRIRNGTYTAYGQKLEISRGRVVFNGALDNPVLDITAVRRGPAVEAGVAVTGTVLSPRVRLVSEPDVPDSQKLSWLVLGVGPEDARTGSQVAALQAAAATLFGGGGGGLVSDIQESLGLDVLTIRNAAASGFDANFGASFPGQAGTGSTATTGATQDVIAIGKRLGSRMMVTYEQGLRGVWSLLRVQYDITRRLSLRAQTGTDTALDLLYFYSYD